MGTQYMTMTVTMSMTMTRVLSTFIIILSVSGALAQDDDVPSCQPGDLFLPDPDDCDSYYMCDAGGVAVAMDCPEGLYFDITLSLCNWPENVDCIDDSPETLECMEGMTACLLSSEEDKEEGEADAVDLNDLRKNEK